MRILAEAHQRVERFLTAGRIVAGALVIVAGLTGLNYGLKRGEQIGASRVVLEATAEAERDQQILNVIVRRNPSATIKDFNGFPQALVREARKHGFDYRYVMAIIDKESEWNPRARSSAGAIGLMQVMPSTGAIVAKNIGVPFHAPQGNDLGTLGDPLQNVILGTTHLKGLVDSYGLGPEHLRAYNRGDVAARAHWPGDHYAEDVALRFVRLAATVPQ